MAETTTKFGAPTNFYIAKATYSTNHAFASETFSWCCDTDTGVFVTSSPGEYGWNSYVHGQLPCRITSINKDKRSFGALNMYTSICGAKSFGFIGYTNLMDAHKMSVGIGFFNSRESNDAKLPNELYKRDPRYISSKTNNLWVTKTEAAFPTHYTETGVGERDGEIVYATGLSVFDGSTNLQSIIIARTVNFDGSGYPDLKKGSANEILCDNGSILFDANGNCFGTIKGNNIADNCGTAVVQAIPHAAMAGNDGIAALSCMATNGVESVWLSHRNGIYKLYQGTTPLIGMPGDKVTIKGHEFACLAYGPFYIRMS